MKPIMFRGLSLFFILFVSTVFVGCENWTQQFPTSKPSPRTDHAMAYIGGDRALLFGGFASEDSDETWVYDLSDNTWTQKAMINKPPARRSHAMANIGGDKVLLFGGGAGAFSAFQDTWVYDFSEDSWSEELLQSDPPSARAHHSMSYSGDNTVMLFGGIVNTFANRETWVYDLSDNTWTQQIISGDKPSARHSHAMAYLGENRVVLLGGILSDVTRSGETWRYVRASNLWILMPFAEPPPAPRSDHALADIGVINITGSHPLVLFGGATDTGISDETWIYGSSNLQLVGKT